MNKIEESTIERNTAITSTIEHGDGLIEPTKMLIKSIKDVVDTIMLILYVLLMFIIVGGITFLLRWWFM